MAAIKKIVTAQNGRVQAAGSSRTSTPGIDTRGSLRIASQVIARPWPAVLEDASSSFPLGRQGATDRVAHQVANVTTKIQAGQGAAHLGLRAEQCRGHAISPAVEVVEQIGQCRVDRLQLVAVQDGQQRDEMVETLPSRLNHGEALTEV